MNAGPLVGLSLCVALTLPAASALALDEPPSYVAVVQKYAAGERAVAVLELASFGDARLVKELDALRERVNARCPSCPLTLPPVLLRAAAMLHTDRDELDRRPLQLTGERTPTCSPPVQALMAERALALQLADPGGPEFARRWYLAMALRGLGDLCFDEGRQWVAAGLKRFGKDKELLLVRGVLAEALAAVSDIRRPSPGALTPRELAEQRELQVATHALLGEAAASFEQVLASDPSYEEAALRLGRARYRLGQQAQALAALAPLIERSHDPGHLYLAHLFAGRAHEAARRGAEAEREYAAALATEDEGQAAALALSHLRLMAGDASGARAVLDATLGRGTPRTRSDPFWDYQFGQARRATPLFEALRDEATTR